MRLKDVLSLIFIVLFWYFIVCLFQEELNPFEWSLFGKIIFVVLIMLSEFNDK